MEPLGVEVELSSSQQRQCITIALRPVTSNYVPFRFGGNQRSKQSKNQPLPHVLAMTATPTPRTLALTLHGDMALSAIDEMPPGRKPVLTYAYLDNKANRSQVRLTCAVLML